MGSSSLNFDSLWVTAYHFHKSVQVFFLLSVVQLISAVSQITFHFHILSLFIQVSQKKKFKITNFLFHSAMKKIRFLSLMHSKICISSSWFPNGYLDEVGFLILSNALINVCRRYYYHCFLTDADPHLRRCCSYLLVLWFVTPSVKWQLFQFCLYFFYLWPFSVLMQVRWSVVGDLGCVWKKPLF